MGYYPSPDYLVQMRESTADIQRMVFGSIALINTSRTAMAECDRVLAWRIQCTPKSDG